jgi:hypothetical protein
VKVKKEHVADAYLNVRAAALLLAVAPLEPDSIRVM